MNRRTLLQSLPVAALLPSATWPISNTEPQTNEEKSIPSTSTVYELRIYHANEGKLDDLLRRFRDHTLALFSKHNMKTLAFWTAADEPLKANTLVYILVHPSREAAKTNWQAFQSDPEWQSVRDTSEVNGKLVDHVDSTYLALTDFSPPLR
jgi:hypothetical protein